MAENIYTQLVLEHSRAPRNFGSLESHTHAADGANPLCGDNLHIELEVSEGRIAQMRFRGEACAISRAAASMLSERASNLDAADVAQLGAVFSRVVNGEIAQDAALGDLNAMAALAHYPTRRKCAFLPFATLRAALAGESLASTEKNAYEGTATMNSTVAANAETAIIFRNAAATDIPALVALVTSAYRGDASRKGWTTEADMLDGQRIDPAGIAEIIAKADSRVIVFERDQKFLACCHIDKQGDACYFGMFAVDPALQGGGVGRFAMNEAERAAREDFGCRQMQMTVISIRDELIAWYERRGYRRTGTYKPFPYGDERFGIPKRPDLKFELLVKPL